METQNEQSTCPHCGAKIRQYNVPLTRGIVRALIKFRRAVHHHGRNRIHLLKDMKGTAFELTPHEWNNFSRLRFHGLVAKYRENGEHISGLWLLTHRGAQFLSNAEEIPASVTVFRNQVIGHSDHLISVTDVMKDEAVPYFEKRDDIHYEAHQLQIAEPAYGKS